MLLLLACLPGPSGPPASAGDPGRDVGWVPDSGPADDPGRGLVADTGVSPEPPGQAVPSRGPIVVYAVRHAEKDSGDDPGLTEEGAARAQALADRLAAVSLAGVYATELRRTQETVQPTADAHGLPVITRFEPYEELAEHILAVHEGDQVLHAGHSYTLPTFFTAMGLEDPPDVDGYGQLWTIVVDDDGATVSEGRFGD